MRFFTPAGPVRSADHYCVPPLSRLNLKVYLADSGVLHALLNVHTQADLGGHPKVGASWEGFALGEVLTRLGVQPEECFF